MKLKKTIVIFILVFFLIVLVSTGLIAVYFLLSGYILNYGSFGNNYETLEFNANSSFKILHLCDLHYHDSKRRNSELTIEFIKSVIEIENPDLLVFGGDTIDYNCEDAKECLGELIQFNIPYTFVLGNHDQESNLYRGELAEYLSTLPNSLFKVGDGHVYGFGNNKISISDKFDLFFFDSGDYALNGVYDYIRPSQEEWYKVMSKKLPEITFFHIPLKEVNNLVEIFGEKNEGVYSSIIGSGIFETFVDNGSMKGVFFGHDHINDFCGKMKEITFCYGGSPTYQSYNLDERRIRVIEISNFGEKLDTWLRLDNHNLEKINTLNIL